MLLFVTVEAAVHNLTLMPLNNSEVMATWDVNPDLFELSFFNVTYFIKPEQQQSLMVTVNSYQISDLIPGETYTVRITAYYSEATGSRVFPAVSTERTVSLETIGMLLLMEFKKKCDSYVLVQHVIFLSTYTYCNIYLKLQTNVWY